MEIERINENTVKFYISYVDIENRGFEREDIWYNRERSEQLFWQMMDEVNYKEDFSVEGPLWIQVQALEKGLEIIVTKAHLTKDEEPIDSIDNLDDTMDITIDEKAKAIFGQTDSHYNSEGSGRSSDDSTLWMTAKFNNLEDVIQLSHSIWCEKENDLITKLFYYDDRYYLYIEMEPETFEHQEDILSQVLEYSNESDVTYHVLSEYGNIIFQKDVFSNIRKYFKAEA